MFFVPRGGDLMGTVRTRLILAMAVMVAASLALGAGGALAQDKDAAEKASPKKMILSGVFFGVTRVPEIAAWSCPGGQMAGCSLSANIKSGTEVTRYEKERARGLDWYRIESSAGNGWVRDMFLVDPEK
jgi:hypothetical protein